MKFVSKSSNLRIILKPGQPPEPVTGRLAVPTMFVKFENGEAEVATEEMIKMMIQHPGYNSDFFPYNLEDPVIQKIVQGRQSGEPEHSMVQLKYGHVEKDLNPASKIVITPETKAAIAETAVEMAKKIAVEMVKEQMEPIKKLLETLAAKQEDKKAKGKKAETPDA